MSASPRLMVQVRNRLRAKKRAYSTEKAYVDWILQYIRFHGIVHPRELGTQHIDAFLTHLAVERNVTASTQNQARSALVFLYSQVLKMDCKIGADAVRAKESQHLPVVLWEQEVAEIFQAATGRDHLMLTMLYGAGLRGRELLALRCKDIDFYRGQLLVRDAKGAKDRYALLPKAAFEPLRQQLRCVERRLKTSLADGFPGVSLPYAIDQKYPRARFELGWQFVFPASQLSNDPRSGNRRLHHLHATTLRRAVSTAARKTRIRKHIKVHTFRHSFATHLLMAGVDVRTVQQLLGHKSIETTEVYLHILRSSTKYVTSPADKLLGG